MSLLFVDAVDSRELALPLLLLLLDAVVVHRFSFDHGSNPTKSVIFVPIASVYKKTNVRFVMSISFEIHFAV